MPPSDCTPLPCGKSPSLATRLRKLLLHALRLLLHRLGADIVRYAPPRRFAPSSSADGRLSRSDVLERLREAHPFPEVAPSTKPFLWELEGGGRELIEQIIVERDVRLVLEIGSFLGGSTERWLRASPELVAICVDPWPDAWAGDYVARHGFEEFRDQLNREGGFLMTFAANLQNYRDRVIPIRRSSPDGLVDLFLADVRPDLIYIDADKKSNSIRLCRQLWPSAILTGDDWTWSGHGEDSPVERAVTELAAAEGGEILQQLATWVLLAP